jgi:hypothetical protein
VAVLVGSASSRTARHWPARSKCARERFLRERAIARSTEIRGPIG